MEAPLTELEKRHLLRRRLAAYVVSIAKAAAASSGLNMESSVMEEIVRLALHQAEQIAADCALFSAHAKRRNVTAGDVILCAHRNPLLMQKLQEFDETSGETQKAGKSKQKPTSILIE